MTTDRQQQVRELTKAGMTAQQIADVLHISTRTVTRHREPGRGYPPISEDTKKRIAQMVADGASVREISRTLGVHDATITRHFPAAPWTYREAAIYARQMDHIRRQAHQNGIPL